MDEILANITSNNFMSTKNGCFAFKQMSLGLFGTTFTFQKAINIILKSVLVEGVLVYLEVTFKEHFRLLGEDFSLLHNAGLTVIWRSF